MSCGTLLVNACCVGWRACSYRHSDAFRVSLRYSVYMELCEDGVRRRTGDQGAREEEALHSELKGTDNATTTDITLQHDGIASIRKPA